MKSPTMVIQGMASRPKFVQSLFLCTLIFAGFLFLQQQRSFRPHALSERPHVPDYREIPPSVAKVSMLYGKPNKLYQRAMHAHERHASMHGYPQYVLHNEIVRGFWNKPLYMMSLLLQELEKEPGDRVDWLMWFDADTILMNPEMPLSLFLPPASHAVHYHKSWDEKHLLVTKDVNGLNNGIFFIRVHEWSASFLAKNLAYTSYHPGVDLGFSVDQRAMELLINDTDSRNHTVFVPSRWINSNVGDTEPGSLLVHFPGLTDREWHMKYWLNRAEGPEQSTWEVPVEQTSFAGETPEFWRKLIVCNEVVDKLEQKVNETDHTEGFNFRVGNETLTEITYLKDMCWYLSDKKETLETVEVRAKLIEAAITKAVEDVKLEAEKKQAEILRAEKEKAEKEKAEKERIEKAEREKAEKEKAAKEKAEREKAEKEMAETLRADALQAENQLA